MSIRREHTRLAIWMGIAAALLLAQSRRAAAQSETRPLCGELVEVGQIDGRPALALISTINDRNIVGGADDMGLAALWDPATGERTTIGALSGTPGMPTDGNASTASEVAALNDHGEATGDSVTSDENVHAFYWSASSGLVDVGALGGDFSRGLAINARGQVVGEASDAELNIRPFVWTLDSGIVDLGLLPGCTRGIAVDINDYGVVTGHMSCGTDQESSNRAFIWHPAIGLRDLGLLDGADTYATSIDAFGRVTGLAREDSGQTRLFRWHALSGFTELGSFGDSLSVNASNDAGVVVGTNERRAFIDSPARGYRELNLSELLGNGLSVSSEGIDINRQGWVVGVYYTGPKSVKPFIWRDRSCQ